MCTQESLVDRYITAFKRNFDQVQPHLDGDERIPGNAALKIAMYLTDRPVPDKVCRCSKTNEGRGLRSAG